MFSLEAAQSFLRQAKIDAWLVYDFRGSNPVFRHLLDQSRAATRRAFLVIRPEGEPILLTHPVDQAAFRTVSCPRRFYRGWLEMRAMLKELLGEVRVLALEYSSEGSLPAAASVDAGTVELLRSWGYEIVSSADLFQVSAAALCGGCDLVVHDLVELFEQFEDISALALVALVALFRQHRQ